MFIGRKLLNSSAFTLLKIIPMGAAVGVLMVDYL